MTLAWPRVRCCSNWSMPARKLAPQAQALRRQPAGRLEILDFKVGLGRVGLDHKRRVLGAVETGSAGAHRMRQIHVRRQRAARPEFARHNRADRRVELVVGNRVVAIGEVGLASRHHVVVTGAVAVDAMAMAAENRVLVGDLRAVRQLVGDERAGHGGGNRLERAADFRRRVGLGIPHVLVRRPAFEKDENARLGLGGDARGGLGLHFQQTRQREPADQPAGAQSQGMAP